MLLRAQLLGCAEGAKLLLGVQGTQNNSGFIQFQLLLLYRGQGGPSAAGAGVGMGRVKSLILMHHFCGRSDVLESSKTYLRGGLVQDYSAMSSNT